MYDDQAVEKLSGHLLTLSLRETIQLEVDEWTNMDWTEHFLE